MKLKLFLSMSGDEAVVSGIDGGMDINYDGASHPYLKLIVKSQRHFSCQAGLKARLTNGCKTPSCALSV